MAAQTVSKGLSTWAGIVGAVGQYAAAVAVYLADPDKATALGPLATATLTLITVILGRMSQAKAKTLANAPRQVPSLSLGTRASLPPATSVMAQQVPDYSNEVPGGGFPVEAR